MKKNTFSSWFSAPINWSLKQPFHKLFLNLSFQDSILSKVYNKQSIAANQQKIRLTLSDRMGLKKIICSLGCQLSDKKFHFCFLSHCPTIKRFSSINERPLRPAIHTMSCPLRQGVSSKNRVKKKILKA